MNILITGGSSGIGKAIVQQLNVNGSNKVTFTYCSRKEEAIELENDHVSKIYFDINSDQSVLELSEHILNSNYDVLINNACISTQPEKFFNLDIHEFNNFMQKGLNAVIRLSQSFGKNRKKIDKSGNILNILSSYTLGMPPVQLTKYVTLKYALLGLTRAMASELISYGIRVNAVSPSMVKTNFISNLDERIIEMTEQRMLMKRLVTPEEIAKVVSFLISDSASYINGANIPITGGEFC